MITLPSGATKTFTSDVYDTRVVDAALLFDEGRVPDNAVGADHTIMEMHAGTHGGLLMNVVASEGSGGTVIARFDADADTVTTLGGLGLSTLLTAAAEGDAGDRLVCMARPVADTLTFGELTFPDRDADSICALHVADQGFPLELRAWVADAFFEAAGLVWLRGHLYAPDPLLGGDEGADFGRQPPFLVALDLATRSAVARAHWTEPGRGIEIDDAFLARAACDAASGGGAALRGTSYDPEAGSDIAAVETTREYRLVFAGRDASACTSDIVTLHQRLFVEGDGNFALSPTPTTDCAHARYLAAIPDTGRIAIQTADGERSATGTGEGLDLVVFSPSQCRIERR